MKFINLAKNKNHENKQVAILFNCINAFSEL